MSLDQNRRNLTRKEDRLASLQKQLATAQSKLSASLKKATENERAAAKTKSESGKRNRLRAAQSARDTASKRQIEISKLQDKTVSVQKDIQRLKEKILQEEKRQIRRDTATAKQEKRRVEAELGNIQADIRSHENRLDILERVPQKIVVLYLGVSPLDEGRLRIEQEARDVRQAIRLSDNPDAVDLQERWAIRQNDILQAFNETNPTIVHFSGHGDYDGNIIIEDAVGNSQFVSKDATAAVVGAAAKQVQLIVFNACFSNEDYEKVLGHVDAVIGMTTSISDSAAIAFASQLYSSIGFGLSLQQSFDQARAAIALVSPEEVDTPSLHVRDGLDPTEIYYVSPGERSE